MKIVILKGQSQYDCSRVYLDYMLEGFEELGHQILMIDLCADGAVERIENAIDEGCDFFISFNAMGIDFKISEKPLYDYTDIPLITVLGDHPFYHMDRLGTEVKNILILCMDESHTYLIDKYFPEKACTYFPLYGMEYRGPEIISKDIDVLFAGTVQNSSKLKQGWEQYGSKQFDILKTIHTYKPNNNSITIVDAIENAMIEHRIQPENLMEYRMRSYVLYEAYYRNKLREELLETFSQEKIKVKCFGNIQLDGSEFLDINQGGNAKQTLELMKRSHISLNLTPFLVNGVTDRSIGIMLNNSLCLTDYNDFYRQNFDIGKELITYSRDNIKEAAYKAKELLNNKSQIREISQLGYERAKCSFSPNVRCQMLIEIIKQYMSIKTSNKREVISREYEKEQQKRKVLREVKKYMNMYTDNTMVSKIPYAGRIYDQEEVTNLVDAALDFWLTAGHYADTFEKKFAEFLGSRYCLLVNSGSSANLLAFMALTSPQLGDRRIKRGDEVITVAAGFPTTVAPIIQYGSVPVFVDIKLPEYNIDVIQLEKALTLKTKAVMIAHTLGNPFDLNSVKHFCDQHGLWLIEDNCDALGSKYIYNGEEKYTGTIGHIGTSSFYPPHHMTMGEGGAVYTDSPELKRIMQSLRDWGRDCWCPSGQDDTCKHRFTQQFGELPLGYDHKYVYSHFGYNLKVTDMQAAVGCAQLKKLPGFIEARRYNWGYLREKLDHLKGVFILPEAQNDAVPSWFGFLMTVRNDAGFTRDDIVTYLEDHNIQTRMLFAGNLIKHPCFDEMRATGEGYRVVGELTNTDIIMKDTFWIGVYPGMTKEMLDYMINKIEEFVQKHR